MTREELKAHLDKFIEAGKCITVVNPGNAQNAKSGKPRVKSNRKQNMAEFNAKARKSGDWPSK